MNPKRKESKDEMDIACTRILKREDMCLDKMNNTNPTKIRDEIRCSGRVRKSFIVNIL